MKTMTTEVIHEGTNKNGQRFKAVAFYGNNGFLYTKTYIYDMEGYVDKTVTVFSDGTIDIQPAEPMLYDLEPITHFFQD